MTPTDLAPVPAAFAVALRSWSQTDGATWVRTFDHQQVDGTSSTVSWVTPATATMVPRVPSSRISPLAATTA